MSDQSLPAAAPAFTTINPTRRRLIAGAATALALPAAAAAASPVAGMTTSHPDAEILRLLGQFADLERECNALAIIEEERTEAAESELDALRDHEREVERINGRWIAAKGLVKIADPLAEKGGLNPIFETLEKGHAEALAKLGPAPATEEQIKDRHGIMEIETKMDAVRKRINEVIDQIVEIPAKTPAGVFAKLRLTQFYEPGGISTVYGCAEIFADIDRLSPETTLPEVGA
jgi:hypothetical protein